MQTPEKYRSLFPNPLPNNPEYLSIVHPNQINNAWLGVCGYQPFAQHISSSRAQMLSQHIGQALVMMEPDERMIQTTADKEYAKYTFAVAMPQNGRILHYIQKYPPGLGADTIKANPKTTVIYESEDGQIDYFDLEDYHTEHQYFGFRYEASEKLSQLRPGQDFKKGEVFLKSPLVSERGGWKLGATANVAMFSHPGTAEDSVLVRRGFLKRMRFKTYRTRVFEYGRNEFPRNLYGDEKKFKIMPDIGELIAPHGYLCAMGKYDDANLAFVEQSAKSMREIDEFDNTVHVGPGGRVVDIQVIHDMKDDKYIQPDMDAQVLKYYQAGKKYYQEIYDVYRRLLAQRGAGLNISGRFHHLVVEAQTVITPTKARTIHRRTPIDRFRVVVTVEYEIEPNIGFKVTGLSGDKAIMCKIVEDCDMPVDAHGTVADFVTSEDSTVGRNNVSRLYEQYVSSAQVQLHREICHALGAMPKMAFARAIKHLNAVPELAKTAALL
jgi:DNA-directed RNA polymerase beta subunit